MREDIKSLDVYTESLVFSNLIWQICAEWDYFARKTLGVQLVRAADSISANIAEGYGRFHYKENLNFCYYARGSFEEIKDWIRKAVTRNLISEEHKNQIDHFMSQFLPKLNSYINYIKKQINKKD
ncbi:four helix bundle protein, partial [bacterium]|nr:four helix bundle protein [bacterium]